MEVIVTYFYMGKGITEALRDTVLRRVIEADYEGKRVEHKYFLDLDDNEDHRIKFCKEIISLANKGGGYLVFGLKEVEEGLKKSGMNEKEVPDENEINDLVNSKINQKIDVELRHFKYHGKNYPVFYVEQPEYPIVVQRTIKGDSEILKEGTIYWRVSGSAEPLSDTNQLIDFLKRYHHVSDPESYISIDEHLDSKKPLNKKEELFSNMFSVIELPEKVKLAKTSFDNKNEAVRHIYRETNIPRSDFILWEGKLVTFSDLDHSKNQLRTAINGAIAVRDFKDWREEQKGDHDIDLLNACFYNYAGYRGLTPDLEKKRFYFESSNGSERYRWHPSKETPRNMVWELDQYEGYVHKALEGGFKKRDQGYYMYINSSWVTTRDGGRHIVRGELQNVLSNQFMDEEQNHEYLQNIRFWISLLANKSGIIKLSPHYNLKVDASPMVGNIGVGSANYMENYDFEPTSYWVGKNE